VPNTNDLGVENADKVDQPATSRLIDQLRANVPGIYALVIATDAEPSLIRIQRL